MSGLAAIAFWGMVGTGLLHLYPAMWTCFALTTLCEAIHQAIVASRVRATANAADQAMRLQAEYIAAAIARTGPATP